MFLWGRWESNSYIQRQSLEGESFSGRILVRLNVLLWCHISYHSFFYCASFTPQLLILQLIHGIFVFSVMADSELFGLAPGSKVVFVLIQMNCQSETKFRGCMGNCYRNKLFHSKDKIYKEQKEIINVYEPNSPCSTMVTTNKHNNPSLHLWLC